VTPLDRTTAQRLSPFVIAIGVAMIVVAVIGVLASGGSDDQSAAGTPTADTRTPPIPTSVVGTTPATRAPTTTPPTAARPVETAQEFFAALQRAFRDNDDVFLFARLHPLVIARYGAEQCRAYFAQQFAANYSAEVLGVRAAEPWDWTLDGRTDNVAAAIPVRVRSTDDGTSFREVEAHLALVDGQIRWFTDCGTPI
jgi:hypothetical protein